MCCFVPCKMQPETSRNETSSATTTDLGLRCPAVSQSVHRTFSCHSSSRAASDISSHHTMTPDLNMDMKWEDQNIVKKNGQWTVDG